jgi:hypothetical protein
MDRQNQKRKQQTSLGDVVKVDPTRRVIDMTAGELTELLDSRIEMFLDGAPKPDNADGLLPRVEAAKFLAISLSKLDLLCRREADPVPFRRIGDSRRFDRAELKAWALRQGGDE